MPLPLVMHILFIVTFHSPLLTALSRHEATPGGSGPASRPPLHLTRVLGDPRGPPGPSAGTLGRAMRHPGRFPEGGSRSFPLQRGRTFSSYPSLPQPRGGQGDAVPTPPHCSPPSSPVHLRSRCRSRPPGSPRGRPRSAPAVAAPPGRARLATAPRRCGAGWDRAGAPLVPRPSSGPTPASEGRGGMGSPEGAALRGQPGSTPLPQPRRPTEVSEGSPCGTQRPPPPVEGFLRVHSCNIGTSELFGGVSSLLLRALLRCAWQHKIVACFKAGPCSAGPQLQRYEQERSLQSLQNSESQVAACSRKPPYPLSGPAWRFRLRPGGGKPHFCHWV